MTLLRAGRAPEARTLVDVLRATAERYGAEPALDDGSTTLSYDELLAAVSALAVELAATGIGPGDKVGVRLSSGTNDLYVAILATLFAGAAYVPVDADDPDERADLVFTEATVAAVLTDGPTITAVRPPEAPGIAADPAPKDDAWVIFTSGSTGVPKGVAVTHRSAAAFVDAEARLFLAGEPIGPDDRVLAGLSVAFDASCEEMWLAWRHGACLVPAPRALVRTGMDLGPWLVAQGITVVSTVPTLAALWPADALDQVRLLIFGGEACPPELAERLAVDGREVWNTYGPTEATVVACGARLTGEGPVRIGLPLDGWDLAVVDAAGNEVAEGEVGELIIGGVGLARYLDPVKDAEKFAPMPSLGWERAYRSGDLVRHEAAGLVFQGRADEQVKLGGRRIELGEVDAALQALPGITGAAAAVKTTAAGTQVLVGYLVASENGGAAAQGSSDATFDTAAAMARLREALPAALVPLLAVVDTLPTRTSGKVDRDALPWPVGPDPDEAAAVELDGTAGWLADRWTRVLGAPVTGPDDDFFLHGGGSLSAAQLVSQLRERYAEVTVGDMYGYPRLGALAERLDEFDAAAHTVIRDPVRPTPRSAQWIQTGLTLLLQTVVGARFLTWGLTLNGLLALTGSYPWLPTVSWWWVAAGWLVLITPAGRMTHRGGRRQDPAVRRPARQLPARRRRPPAALDGGEPGRRGRCGEPGRRAVDRVLRPRAGREDRPRRRPAHAATGDRDAHRRPGCVDRAGGGPVRLLAGR